MTHNDKVNKVISLDNHKDKISWNDNYILYKLSPIPHANIDTMTLDNDYYDTDSQEMIIYHKYNDNRTTMFVTEGIYLQILENYLKWVDRNSISEINQEELTL